MIEAARRWASPRASSPATSTILRSTAAPAGTQGAGATHAWVEVYLPGAGWVEFDPTNGIVGDRHLIRVGVARDPKQAVPLAGFHRRAGGLCWDGGRGAGDADPNPLVRTGQPVSIRCHLAGSASLTGPAFSSSIHRRWQ